MTARAARLRVGVAANLDAGGSAHRATFERALELAREDFGPHLELCVENDHASVDGGAAAARRLVDRSVEIVIGHYASAAAAGAAPLYERVGAPLLLPAATADALVREHSVVFRICDPDARMVDAMLSDLARDAALHRVAAQNDGSLHGEALTAGLRTRLHAHPHLVLERSPDRADAVVFAGLFAASVEFVRSARRRGYAGLILLADDAVHPTLPERLGDAVSNLSVYGFQPAEWCDAAQGVRRRYRARYGGEPGTYFLETYAAFEIARTAAGRPRRAASLARAIAQTTWRTALGTVRFKDGEGGRERHAIWRPSSRGLRPERRPGEASPAAPPGRSASLAGG